MVNVMTCLGSYQTLRERRVVEGHTYLSTLSLCEEKRDILKDKEGLF